MADTNTNVIIKNKTTDDPFKSIIAAIQRSQSSTRNTLGQLGEQQRKQNNSNIIASSAKERKDRATNAALLGSIDKTTSIVDDLKNMLKSALDKLTDMISDMAKNALKSYDQTVRGLREVFMSTADMKNEMIKADRASQKLREKGITVTSQQTKQTIEQLNKNGFDSRKFSEEQIAAISVGMKSGLSLQAAVAQSQRTKDQIALAKTFAAASQQTGRETYKALSEALEKDQTAMAVYLKRTGKSQEQASADILKYSQQLDSVLGGYLSNDEQAKQIQQMMLLNSKQLEKLDQPFSDLLGISPDAFKNASNREELMTKGILKMIQSGNIEYVNVLKNAMGQNSPLADAVSQAMTANKAGNYKLGEIKELDDAIDAFNKNNPGGKLGALVDGFMTSINTFTADLGIEGGIFGGLAAEVNELFGENAGMENIVTTGFKEVLKILKTAASKGWGTISAKLAAFNDSKFGKIFSTFLPGILVKTFTGTSTLGWVFKGLKFELPRLLPVLGPVAAVGAAVGSVAYATYKIASTASKLNKPDEIREDISKNDAELNDAKKQLQAYKDADLKDNDKLVMEAAAKVAELEAKGAKLSSDLKQAVEDAKTNTQKDIDSGWEKLFADEEAFKTKKEKMEAEALHYEEAAAKAKAQGNEKAYNRLIKEAQEQRKNIEDENNKLEERRRILTQAEKYTSTLEGNIMSMFDISAEKAAWFQDLNDAAEERRKATVKFFTDLGSDIYNGLGDIGTSISDTWNDITNDISNIGADISETWNDFWNSWSFSDVLPSIDDIKTDIKALWDKIDLSELLGINLPSLPEGGILSAAGSAVGNFVSSIFKADGIVANKPTPSIIGEAGKEILLPLTRPNRMRELLSSLTSSEKSSIISAINASDQNNNSNNNTDLNVQSNSTVPGNDAATINKILSYSSNPDYVYDSIRYGRNKDGSLKSKDPEYGAKKREAWYKESLQNAQNRDGYDLIKGTWAERALAWGASQIGLPYLLRSIGKIGYVCNELTNAALLGSGFDLKDFRIHGVKTTFANISSGKMVSGKDRKGRMREYPTFRLRPDITPENAVPGMIFFQDSSKNKDGQFAPGHVGLVYYGHQRLHSAGGSGDYSSPDAFLNKYQTPCRGVTVNEFDKNARYQFGELPGLFEQASGEWEPPKNAPVEFGPTDINKKPGEAILNEQNNLAESAKSSVTENTSKYQAADMQKYIKLVTGMMGTNNTKEILSFMEVMVKYLRDIANAPANKRPNISPTRPVPNVY